MSKYKVYPLDQLIASDNKELYKTLSDAFNYFGNKNDRRNKIKNFLTNKAKEYNIHNLAKTYLIISNDFKTIDLLGYFTISLKAIDISRLSSNQKHKLLGNIMNKDTIKFAPAYLIGQIEKNDRFNILKKYEIMNECREQMVNAANIVGGRIVILECERDLIEYYKQNGFTIYSDYKDRPSNLYTMYQRIDKWDPKV